MKSITKEAGKVILDEMHKTGETVNQVNERLDLWMIDNPAEIFYACRYIVWDNMELSDKYIAGEEKVLNILIGKTIAYGKKKIPGNCILLGLKIALREYNES